MRKPSVTSLNNPTDTMNTRQPVSEEKVDQVLEDSIITFSPMGMKTIICHAQLPNDFEVVTSASCVDPSDFDREVGKRICKERLRDKLFELIGFQQHPDL